MKLFKNPRLVLPLVLITLLIGATTAYVAISGSFINCASLTDGKCTGVAAHDGQTDDSDLINGSSGDDTINGGGGDDLIFGNDGDDTIDGEEGNDTIFGGSGDDDLTVGDGDDTFWGGPGCDVYDDDTGHNTYIFQPGDVPGGCTEIPPAPVAPPDDTTVCVFLGYSGMEMFVVDDVVEKKLDLNGNGEIEPWEQWEEIEWDCYGVGLVLDPRTDVDNPGEINVSDCDEIYGLVYETPGGPACWP